MSMRRATHTWSLLGNVVQKTLQRRDAAGRPSRRQCMPMLIIFVRCRQRVALGVHASNVCLGTGRTVSVRIALRQGAKRMSLQSSV